ncbi:MAG: CocE/NonD family hydrolase [Gemmataceae bacterium]|nr:CocE/NonD family hydrolase [Gemmataceae bacterium]
MRSCSIVVLCWLSVVAPLRADLPKDPAQYVREHYTKQTYQVPMRDGVRLYTIVYSPKDRSQRYPMLMMRTPYGIGPYEPDKMRSQLGPSGHFLTEGYIFVYQDVRGCYMSEGEFENVRPQLTKKGGPKDIDESTDTFDTIEFLLNNVPNHNGRVGQFGISYPGFYTSAGMINAHPALKAASPQAPIADWFFDDFNHHGAFFLAHAFAFLSNFGQPRPTPTTTRPSRFQFPTPDGYRFYLDLGPLKNANARYFKNNIAFWNTMAAHPNYDDFWQARNLLPHLKNVAPAVMIVGGCFDAEDLYGTYQTYRAIERQNPGIFNVMVIGPWSHGGWARGETKIGNISFPGETAKFYQEHVELKFFNHFLKDKGDHGLPEALVYETGANRWRQFATWPPAGLQAKKLYFHAGGRLAWHAPTDHDEASDSFLSDPNRPVPHTERITTAMTYEYMTDDQRYASRRPDVLVYQTPPLTEAVTLAGPLTAELHVATTGTDADWVVKLIDVFPDDAQGQAGDRPLAGYQMHVRSEVIRGRFRNSYAKPEPFTPNEPALVRFELQDVLHTFGKGHRIMVQVCSTWFPLVDRNPQKFVANIFEAEESDFTPATHRVYRSRTRASNIVVGVLPP